PKDKQSSLFQPFYRAKSKQTRHIEGTGLGLYLVKNVIDRHHGTLIFKSTEGKGSHFGFDIPMVKK
ncbi:MAG: ATP-binding protein, partial [Anaerolineae bacterium]|nr:ATP-binding protein [Anaerolineae bacterium]